MEELQDRLADVPNAANQDQLLARLKERIDQLSRKLDDAQQACEAKDNKIEELLREIDRLRRNRDEADELRRKVDDLEKALEDQRNRHEDELDKLRKQMEDEHKCHLDDLERKLRIEIELKIRRE